MKILIVDDNEPMRREVANAVHRSGDEIHTSGDGSLALELFAATRPDWVLMDIRMNTMDGLTATRKILALDPLAMVAIVTNYVDDKELRDAAFAAGAKIVLGKERLDELRPLIDAYPG